MSGPYTTEQCQWQSKQKQENLTKWLVQKETRLLLQWCSPRLRISYNGNLMPLFHKRIKPWFVLGTLILASQWKKTWIIGRKMESWSRSGIKPRSSPGSLRCPQTSHDRSLIMRWLSHVCDQFQPRSCQGYTNWVLDWYMASWCPGTNNRFTETAMTNFCCGQGLSPGFQGLRVTGRLRQHRIV